LGISNGGDGVEGFSQSRNGVFGQSETGSGLHGYSKRQFGIYARSDAGTAGFFEGNVTVTGKLEVQGVNVTDLIHRIQQLEAKLQQATQAALAAQQAANAVQRNVDQALTQAGLKITALEQAIAQLQLRSHSHS
jgi:hypothetical protein